MKKAVVILFALVSVNQVAAQRIIPWAGLTMSTISYNNNYYDYHTKYGYSAGVGFEFPVSKNLYLQPKIGIAQKGSNFNGYSDKHDLSLRYLQTFFLLKKEFEFKKVSFYVLAGPAISLGIGGKYQYDYGQSETFDVVFKPYPPSGYDLRYFAYVDHAVDYGLTIGLGVPLFKKVNIEVLYEHGLRDLYTPENRGDFGNAIIQNAKNRTWQIGLSVPFKMPSTQNKKSDKEKDDAVAKPTARIIPRLGITASVITFDFKTEHTVGLTAGIGYEVPLRKNFSIQPELNFIQKGTIWPIYSYNDYQFTLNYLEIPLFVKLQTGDRIRLNFLAGPFVAIGLGGTINSGYNSTYIDQPPDVGGQIGMGIEFFKKAMLDIRFAHGFTKVFKDPPYDNQNTRTQTWAIGVSVPFKTRSK